DRLARLARAWPLLLLAVPAALLLPLLHPMGKSAVIVTVGFTALYVAFGALVLLADAYPDFGSRGPRSLVLPAKLLAAVGVYSYTIYLFHAVVLRLPGVGRLRDLIRDHAGLSSSLAGWGDRVLFWALAVGGGVLLAHAVERPFLRLRDRLYPSRRRGEPSQFSQKQPLRLAGAWNQERRLVGQTSR